MVMGILPGSRRCPINQQSNKSFPEEKSALLTIAVFPQPEPWLKLRKINALKSP
jgi:hypothetical protein